jgi:hypothetical protein
MSRRNSAKRSTKSNRSLNSFTEEKVHPSASGTTFQPLLTNEEQTRQMDFSTFPSLNSLQANNLLTFDFVPQESELDVAAHERKSNKKNDQNSLKTYSSSKQNEKSLKSFKSNNVNNNNSYDYRLPEQVNSIFEEEVPEEKSQRTRSNRTHSTKENDLDAINHAIYLSSKMQELPNTLSFSEQPHIPNLSLPKWTEPNLSYRSQPHQQLSQSYLLEENKEDQASQTSNEVNAASTTATTKRKRPSSAKGAQKRRKSVKSAKHAKHRHGNNVTLQIPHNLPKLPQITPIGAYQTSPHDWFEKKLVDVRSERNQERRVIALEYLPFNEEKNSVEFNEKNVIWVGKFTGHIHQSPNELTREQARFVVTDSKKVLYDLRNSWIGQLNHAPNTAPEQNVSAFLDGVIQDRAIERGEELRWDYGIEYWIFQLTGVDRVEWSDIDLGLFREMHERVVDYDALLAMKIYQYSDREDMVTAVQMYLHQFPRKQSALIYRNTLPINKPGRHLVKPAIYLKSSEDLYDNDDDEEQEQNASDSASESSRRRSSVASNSASNHKIIVKTEEVHYTIPHDESNALGSEYKKNYYPIRFVTVENAGTGKKRTYLHAADVLGYIVRKSNVPREIAKFSTPLQKLKANIPNKHNNKIGKEANILTHAGTTALLNNLKMRPLYKQFLITQVLPHLSS